MEKTKLCTIPTYGELPILGGIRGPVLTPSNLTYKQIITLINAGITVYEINPRNRKDKVLLSLRNIKSNNFNNVTTTVKETIVDKTPLSEPLTSIKESKITTINDKSDNLTKPDFF